MFSTGNYIQSLVVMHNGKLKRLFVRIHIYVHTYIHTYIWASVVAQTVKNLPAMCETRVQSLGQEDHGNPLQCSCLETPMDRGAWWATVHGVAKSWTQLRN